MSNWRIPLSDLDYGPEEETALLRVLKSEWLSMGPEVEAFEKEFADFIGVKHAFAVANGTAALHLAYLALGIVPGEEVIQPAINFVAAANMTLALGAKPMFADIISLSEPTINPFEIERLITPHTKAVVVMHYGGYLCRMVEVLALCERYKLALIEDACHAVGACYHDSLRRKPDKVMAGAIGDVGCFSFFSNKNLATGEGGMVVTSRADVAERLRLLRSHGMTTLTWDRHRGHASSYDVITHGFNYRMDELRAALGGAQLRKLSANNLRRRQHVQLYRRYLRELEGWVLPFNLYKGDSACHLMTVIAPNPETRREAVSRLKTAGIQTSLHYPNITGFGAFSDYKEQILPLSEVFATRVCTLPLYPSLSEDQISEICLILRNCC